MNLAQGGPRADGCKWSYPCKWPKIRGLLVVHNPTNLRGGGTKASSRCRSSVPFFVSRVHGKFGRLPECPATERLRVQVDREANWRSKSSKWISHLEVDGWKRFEREMASRYERLRNLMCEQYCWKPTLFWYVHRKFAARCKSMKYWGIHGIWRNFMCCSVKGYTYSWIWGAHFCDLRVLVNPCRSRCGGLSEAIQNR